MPPEPGGRGQAHPWARDPPSDRYPPFAERWAGQLRVSRDDVSVASTFLLAALDGVWWAFFLPHAAVFGVLFFIGLRTHSDLMVILLFLGGFAVAAIYFGLLVLASPGLLVLITLPTYFIAAWEGGLLSGTVWRFFRQLLGVSQPPEGTA